MSHPSFCAEPGLGVHRSVLLRPARARLSFGDFLARTRQRLQAPHVPLNDRLLVDIGLTQADLQALTLR